MDTGHDDDLRGGLRGQSRQRQGVSLEVCDPMEDVRRHVVVGEHHRVPLALERLDLDKKRLEGGDLDVG